MNRKAVKRDLELMIIEGVKRNIPVIVGSAGTAGADPNVDWMIGIVKEIAQENKLHFKLAEIKTEITPEQLMYGLDNGFAWHAGKILECGTLATVFEKHHGSMLAWVREDSVSIEPG